MRSIYKLIYKNIVKQVLFLMDPDFIHVLFLKIGNTLGSHSFTKKLTSLLLEHKSTRLAQTLCGIRFDNPVGLSAGFDKDGDIVGIVKEVGFGFESVGTLTPRPYAGNTKPWSRRLIKTKSILVNYGLKNKGIDAFLKLCNNLDASYPYLISVGKTNCPDTVTIEQGIKEYIEILTKLEKSNTGSVYEINISCPNAYGGESFSNAKNLNTLLDEIAKLQLSKPIFLKMPINLPYEEYDRMLATSVDHQISGVIIGNLNKDRSSYKIVDPIDESMKGNLSGMPTQNLSDKLISHTFQKYGDKLIIVGVGGIFSFEDALRKIQLGASLVELITGMIFEGPQLIGNINQKLEHYLVENNIDNISKIVGSSHKKS